MTLAMMIEVSEKVNDHRYYSTVANEMLNTVYGEMLDCLESEIMEQTRTRQGFRSFGLWNTIEDSIRWRSLVTRESFKCAIPEGVIDYVLESIYEEA